MIYTDNRQEKLNVDEEFINSLEAVCDFVLKKEGVNCKYQISLLFVDNEEIREINRETRNIDRATDVLSFPMFEQDEIKQLIEENYEADDVLGDIVISIPKVQEQAVEYGHSFERELAYMCVHGFFHLMGYDHMVESDKVVMRGKEDEILNRLHITREG